MIKFNRFKFYLRFRLKSTIIWIIMITSVILISSGSYQYLVTLSYGLNYVYDGPSESLPELILKLKTKSFPENYTLNKFTFEYRHKNIEKCYNRLDSEGVRLLFLVKSAMNNFENRKVIRETWGKHKSTSGAEISTVFLLGIESLKSVFQKTVNLENYLFHDIVQAEFIDTYDNNTLKTTMAFDWSYKNCKNVDYFIFVDDDYFVSIDNLIKFLKNPKSYPDSPSETPPLKHDPNRVLWAGRVYPRSMPFRYYLSKWYISISEYPYTFYPPYVTGGVFILSDKSFKDLYFAYLFTELFKLDDVYLGMCAKKANLIPIHSNEFAFERRSFLKENYKNLIASHGFRDPQLMREIAFKASVVYGGNHARLAGSSDVLITYGKSGSMEYFVGTHRFQCIIRNECDIITPDPNTQLWAGFVHQTPLVIRYYLNKWDISIKEYPYTYYPSYISGGIFILSDKSFKDLYFAHLFTELFKIDDVYLGMCAKKSNLTPIHNNEFVYVRRKFGKENYKNLIASHGFRNPKLIRDIAFKVKHELLE